MGPKVVPLLGNIPMQGEHPPGYRGRYDGLPPFEDVPPGVEPPVPGFEPSPFEKPPFGVPGPLERERGLTTNYREPYRPPFIEGPGPGYRDMPIPPVQNEIPVHVGDPPRYRENYRPGHQYRDQGPMSFRDGQPYRDSGLPIPFREGPLGPAREFRGPAGQFRDNSYRSNHPYRDGNFRDNPPHNFREGGAPFRPPSTDSRDPVPPNYHDPNFRDGYRDENNREILRPGYRPTSHGRGGSRRNNNIEHERHRDRGRERERFNDNRDPADRTERSRDDKRPGYEKNREGREDRPRDHEKNREYEKERERDYDRNTPDKKVRGSPKRSRDGRDKKRSESRGRSRERDRDVKREKKDERVRDKSSADGTKEHKDKEKKEKTKERKKKKREKDTEKEKKKKRDRKDKKDKDFPKKDDENTEKTEEKGDEKESDIQQLKQHDTENIEKNEIEPEIIHKKEESPKLESDEQPKDDLYGDEAAEAIDKEIIQNYIKAEENDTIDDQKNMELSTKDEPFDGIELQANADELDLKADFESTPQSKETMLAILPELSKWEVEDDSIERSKEPGEITSPEEEEDSGKVTSEVIKRAENAIFAKAINSLRPIEIKKISSDRAKLYSDEPQTKSSIQITVPLSETETRAVEVNDKKRRYSKTPPPRLSVKERLGGKVEEIRRPREPRVVHSTVERVKSRSKTPKKELPYRRVTLEKDRSRKLDDKQEVPKSERRVASEAIKPEKHNVRNSGKDIKKKDAEKFIKPEKPHHGETSEYRVRADKSIKDDKHTSTDRERKKSTLDEAHFEPDYDENVESENETKDESLKKRNRSRSPVGPTEPKKIKLEPKKNDIENDTIKLDLTNVRKKPESESESSSSEVSSSSSSSDARKRKKKRKRAKKKRKRAASDSESESDSSSDDHKKKKKKRKHKKKSSKKKKKSKHK